MRLRGEKKRRNTRRGSKAKRDKVRQRAECRWSTKVRDEVKEARRGRARCGEVRGEGVARRVETRQDGTRRPVNTLRTLLAHWEHTRLSLVATMRVRLSFFLSFFLFPFLFPLRDACLSESESEESEGEREGTRERRLAAERERAREKESRTTESRVGRLPVNRLLHSLLILYERPPMLHRNSHFTLSLSCAHATAGYAFAVG